MIIDPPSSAREGAIAAIKAKINRYTDAIGLTPLRSAVAEKLSSETGIGWHLNDIVITADLPLNVHPAAVRVSKRMQNKGCSMLRWLCWIRVTRPSPFVPAGRHSRPRFFSLAQNPCSLMPARPDIIPILTQSAPLVHRARNPLSSTRPTILLVQSMIEVPFELSEASHQLPVMDLFRRMLFQLRIHS